MHIGDHAIQPDLMQIGRFEFQHLEDTRAVYLTRRGADLRRCAVHAPMSCSQYLSSRSNIRRCAHVEILISSAKPVPYLAFGQRPQEAKVQEGVSGRMVRAHTVLVVAVVDGGLDADGRVNEPNHSRRDTDVVCVASVSRASEAISLSVLDSSTEGAIASRGA